MKILCFLLLRWEKRGAPTFYPCSGENTEQVPSLLPLWGRCGKSVPLVTLVVEKCGGKNAPLCYPCRRENVPS